VPYMAASVEYGLFNQTVLSELKPVPVIVTVTSPLLGAVDGEILEMVGEAVTGIPATTSSRKTIQTKRGNRFMVAHLTSLSVAKIWHWYLICIMVNLHFLQRKTWEWYISEIC